MVIFVILLIIILLFVLFYFVFQFKRVKLNTINMFTGPQGTGKSALSLFFALNKYRKQLFNYYISMFFNYCLSNFYKFIYIEKPLFYSNIPLSFPYVEITKDLLLRKERFNYKSVVWLDEMSLIADNYDFKDLDFNYNIKMFFKLFRHETKGGYLFINTQNIEDNHYIIKRSINQYLYIHHKLRLPFFSICWVKELTNIENTQNINTNDFEDGLKWLIMSNKTFKYYDTYCYSILTDTLKPIFNIIKTKFLKTKKIFTFKEK